MRRPCSGALVAATLLFAAGCGSGSDGTGGDDESDAAIAALLDHLPTETRRVEVMDMATAKRQLGVAADLDPERYPERQVSFTPEERFDSAALEILDYLHLRTPFAVAFDHGRVTAALRATLIPGGELAILRTSQPRDEIARGLAKAGLRRSGDSGFVRPKDKDAFGLQAVVLGDELVVLAETIDVAAGVLRRTRADPGFEPAGRLLDQTPGAFRAIERYPEEAYDPESACLRGVAGGQVFTPGNDDEVLALLVKGEPRASDVTLGEGPAQRKDPLTKPYRVTDISRSGQTLSLKVHTTPDARNLLNAADVAAGHVPPHLIYRCPGAAAQRARRQIEARREIQPAPPEPDRSGSRLETLISNYIAALSAAPNAMRVRCSVQTLPAATRKLRCTGTRRHKGKTFHYTLSVGFEPSQAIKYVDIESPDDTTGTIVSKPTKPKQDDGQPRGRDGDA